MAKNASKQRREKKYNITFVFSATLFDHLNAEEYEYILLFSPSHG